MLSITDGKPLYPLEIQSNHDIAFDVEKVTKIFYDEYDTVFKDFEAELSGFGKKQTEERRLFTQLLFNRLLFLRFIEKKGWLIFEGRIDYLKAIYEAGGIGNKSFFASRIKPLFFEGMAKPGKQKSKIIGEVPYLNGGLFEEKPVDNMVEDIPDKLFAPVLRENGLFYRFNFTVEESTPIDIQVAVDPEMLGKVFEKLVTNRKKQGSYYTPRHIVSFMCRETLKGYLGGFENLVDNRDSIVSPKNWTVG